MISDPSRRFVNIISEDKRPVASGYGHFRLNEKRLVRCELISAFIIKLPNQPRHVRQVEHPKFVDEAIAPKSLYMVDEEAGRIGNHVRQFGQTRTDRKSVVKGKSVSVRVDLGGRGSIKKKRKKITQNKRRN